MTISAVRRAPPCAPSTDSKDMGRSRKSSSSIPRTECLATTLRALCGPSEVGGCGYISDFWPVENKGRFFLFFHVTQAGEQRPRRLHSTKWTLENRHDREVAGCGGPGVWGRNVGSAVRCKGRNATPRQVCLVLCFVYLYTYRCERRRLYAVHDVDSRICEMELD